jgi:hypothetical protein
MKYSCKFLRCFVCLLSYNNNRQVTCIYWEIIGEISDFTMLIR